MSGAGVLLALAGGAVGAVLRDLIVRRLPGAGLVVVNVAGTAVLAAVVALAGAGRIGGVAAATLGPGLAGALTTFSGWVARVDVAGRTAPIRTLAVEVLLPLAAGVLLTILGFVLLA